MQNPRIYGKPPFSVVLVHGGPGASGSMAPVAINLSGFYGIIEPLQTYASIEEQVQEIHTILEKHANLPVTLIGHSWGAWLSIIFASGYPSMIKKLILISSAPFEDKYVSGITEKRLNRLSLQEIEELKILENKLLKVQDSAEKETVFKQFGKLMSKADSFELVSDVNDETDYHTNIFNSVWSEAVVLRHNGELLKKAQNIKCPVTAIHGDYDPHPADGVKVPLSERMINFRFILLEKCGHTPWYEKHAKDRLYKLLREEIGKV